MVYLFVGIGGIVGSLLRYFFSILAANIWGKGFPIGTLLINLTGAFLLGWFVSKYVTPKKLHPSLLTGLSTGLIGSYTTFSTFCLETNDLFEAGEPFLGLLYLFISLIGGLILVQSGLKMGERGNMDARKTI